MVQISQLNISLDIMLIIVIRPLCIKRPQIIGYVKCFDINKTMSFKALKKKPLKRYTKIWGKFSNLMDIKLASEPVYGDNDRYIQAKKVLSSSTFGGM